MTRRGRVPCWAWSVPITLALLAFVTWLPGKAVLDGALERQARRALEADGVGGVTVDVDWARGVLTGPADQRARALASVGTGVGPDRLRSLRYVETDGAGDRDGVATTAAPVTTAVPGATSAVTAAPAATVRALAEVTGNRILLTGTVPTAGVRSSMAGAAAAAFGAARVDDRITVTDGGTPAAAVLTAVDRFATLITAAGPRLSQGALSIVDTAITATGTGFNARATSELSAAVTQADGNGVRAAGTFQAAPADRAGLQAQLTALLGRAGINFASGSAEIDEPSRAVLDVAAASLVAVPGVRIAVNGHTDDEGSAPANRELSQRRAEAVVAYLVGRGVAAGQLTAVGYGADQPVADNATAEGRAANRRIEFAVIGS